MLEKSRGSKERWADTWDDVDELSRPSPRASVKTETEQERAAKIRADAVAQHREKKNDEQRKASGKKNKANGWSKPTPWWNW